jgi:hypothetical protein
MHRIRSKNAGKAVSEETPAGTKARLRFLERVFRRANWSQHLSTGSNPTASDGACSSNLKRK